MVDLGTGLGRELLPLSLGCVTSYARSIPEVEDTYDFQVQFLDHDLSSLIPHWGNPSVVAITFYSWRFMASLRLAEVVKQYYPDCRIILGGPSVPDRPERIKGFMDTYPYVDFLVHGEGEVTFAELLLALESPSNLSVVEGITYRHPDTISDCVTTTPRPRLVDLDVIPSPFLNGFFDDIVKRYGDHLTGGLLETNRGCPFSCTFCAWGQATMGKVRRFDLDRVLDELEWLGKNQFFYLNVADANFGILYERDLAIAKKVSSIHRDTGTLGYFRTCWTKNSNEKILNISDELRTGGVQSMVTLAVQSFHPETLDAIKRTNIKFENFNKMKSRFNEMGQTTYTDVILGLPNETLETFKDGLCQTMTSRLEDLVAIYPCNLIENSELTTQESRDKYGIETRFCFASHVRTAKFKSTDVNIDQLIDLDTREVDEYIVGTSTMPTEDWRQSFIYANMVWALYFYRLAFFVMQYLHQEFGSGHRDFLEYLIHEATENPEEYSRIPLATRHLEAQVDSIMANQPATMAVDGMGDRSFLAQEATMTILLNDADAFYSDISKLVASYCGKLGYEIQSDVLMEVISYQKSRMPIYPKPSETNHSFEYNIPEYFAAITSQDDIPDLVKTESQMEIHIPDNIGDDREQFMFNRIDKGITLKLYDRL